MSPTLFQLKNKLNYLLFIVCVHVCMHLLSCDGTAHRGQRVCNSLRPDGFCHLTGPRLGSLYLLNTSTYLFRVITMF